MNEDGKLYKDEAVLTHLLGYLTAKQWADALKQLSSGKNTALIWELIQIQGKAWDTDLGNEVKEFLGD